METASVVMQRLKKWENIKNEKVRWEQRLGHKNSSVLWLYMTSWSCCWLGYLFQAFVWKEPPHWAPISTGCASFWVTSAPFCTLPKISIHISLYVSDNCCYKVHWIRKDKFWFKLNQQDYSLFWVAGERICQKGKDNLALLRGVIPTSIVAVQGQRLHNLEHVVVAVVI